MKNQQGAALVIVLALLSGSLMLGMSGMNSALIDERLASNYRSSVEAQMLAENGASRLDQNSLETSIGICEHLADNYSSIEDSSWALIDDASDQDNGKLVRYLTCEDNEGVNSVLVQGNIEGTSAVSFIVRSFPALSGLNGWEELDNFFNNIDSFLNNNPNVVETCSSSDISGGGVFYCNSDFNGVIDDSFDDATLIARGRINSQLNIDKNDGITTNFLSLGSLDLRGSGGDVVNGNAWSKEPGNIRGGGNENFNMNYCSPSFDIRGGNNTGNASCDWEVFAQDSGFEAGAAGGGGVRWTQL